jgi:hypothetical protein
MAEIRVEPQRGGRGRLWLLILLLIVIAVAIWYFMTQRGPTASGASASSTAPASGPATTP